MLILADSIINQIVYLKNPLQEGINVFKEIRVVDYEIIQLINQSYLEFEIHIKNLMLSEQLPEGIIGINFGLFESKLAFVGVSIIVSSVIIFNSLNKMNNNLSHTLYLY